eukprot:2949729-Alexandrium_andersonii.AAC.1
MAVFLPYGVACRLHWVLSRRCPRLVASTHSCVFGDTRAFRASGPSWLIHRTLARAPRPLLSPGFGGIAIAVRW